MKFSTSAKDLLDALIAVSRVASTRSAIQALSGVQITATKQAGVQLCATDMDIGLRLPLQAAVTIDGTVVLPARLLLDVARSLPGMDASLEFRPAEQDVEVLSGSASFHIRTLRAEDFPPLPEPTAENAVNVPAAAFVDTINRVARAASRDETRPVLTGVYVHATGAKLLMVATDSYRLSLKETALQAPLVGELDAVIPARALQELAKIVAGVDALEVLRVSRRANQVVFEAGDVVLSSRLIDGQFPNYKQLLPDSFEHELTLSTGDFTDVVRRISLMAQKNAPLRLSFADRRVTVSARTPDVGEASQCVEIPFAGSPFDIGFNPDFLRDGLELADEDLVLRLISPLRPGMLESANGGGYRYLIMPIRLDV
jgi:DNA polymerase-3 subunit beta